MSFLSRVIIASPAPRQKPKSRFSRWMEWMDYHFGHRGVDVSGSKDGVSLWIFHSSEELPSAIVVRMFPINFSPSQAREIAARLLIAADKAGEDEK